MPAGGPACCLRTASTISRVNAWQFTKRSSARSDIFMNRTSSIMKMPIIVFVLSLPDFRLPKLLWKMQRTKNPHRSVGAPGCTNTIFPAIICSLCGVSLRHRSNSTSFSAVRRRYQNISCVRKKERCGGFGTTCSGATENTKAGEYEGRYRRRGVIHYR